MKSRLAAVAAVAIASGLGATAARARTDVQWSVTIGTPVYSQPAPVYVPAPVYLPAPVYVPAPVYAPAPVIVQPRPVVVHHPAAVYYAPRYPHYRGPAHVGYWDRDRDGIPDRYDRRYDPYGDRDRDGVANRWDRYDRDPYRR
jgi:hypothetical protein